MDDWQNKEVEPTPFCTNNDTVIIMLPNNNAEISTESAVNNFC